MPINMMTGEKYRIDYKKLQIELMNMPIFHNKNIQQMYVDKWVAELMEADVDSTNSYLDPANKELMVREKLEAPETFQTVVHMKDNEMYIHFRVSRILQKLKMSGITEADATDISIEEFKEKKIINWTETNKTVEREDPIIIVPFTIGETYKELVIDGNHRITTAIKNNKKTLKAIILDPNEMVANHLFSSSFDLLLYIFQNETVWMGSHFLQNVPDERILMTHSFFMSGNVNVAM